MVKKFISLFLVLLIVLTSVLPTYAYGSVDGLPEHFKENSLQTGQYISLYIETFAKVLANSRLTDLTINKSGTVIENRTVRDLHITKEVGNGNVTLKNVKVLGELLVEGGGKNSIIIEDSSVNQLTANKKSSNVRILLEGNTNVDSTSVKSDAVLEQGQLTGKGFEKIKLDVGTSVVLKGDKKLKFTSDNNKVVEIDSNGIVTAKKWGTSVISAVVNGKKTQICEITVEDPSLKTIRILCIGNSFSQDMVYYLYDIAKSAGINIVIGNLYSSGCSLERHSTYALNNEKAYLYYKWTSSDMTTEDGYTVSEAVLDENWDYITFQQSSEYSGIYSTYQPYLNNLIAYVKGIALNPDVKLALNMTWAYSYKNTSDSFMRYSRDQKIMYENIVSAYKQASYDTGIDMLIPCGTSIQNARTNKSLKALGNELTSDGYHLDTGMGRYIAGLTLFETIINEENIDRDLYEDVKFIPNIKNCTEDLINLAKKAVKNAVAEPFTITSEKADVPKK